jgi:hypothetical protein
LSFFGGPARSIHHPKEIGLYPTHAAVTEIAAESLMLNRESSNRRPVGLINVDGAFIKLRTNLV